ncbi:hypothetical protein M8818_006133 [Zalaria obscura]|uniref:Uncharacterized protein n=1 Tax=Zalaria obscura TaxID=2024903 RepID=A0ACC3SBD9_9PEZI
MLIEYHVHCPLRQPLSHCALGPKEHAAPLCPMSQDVPCSATLYAHPGPCECRVTAVYASPAKHDTYSKHNGASLSLWASSRMMSR